jgi:hypothetical protein
MISLKSNNKFAYKIKKHILIKNIYFLYTVYWWSKKDFLPTNIPLLYKYSVLNPEKIILLYNQLDKIKK